MKKEGNMTAHKNGVQGMFFVRKMQRMTENPDQNMVRMLLEFRLRAYFRAIFGGFFPSK